MGYERFVPEKPPARLGAWMKDRNNVVGVITFKAIGKEDVEGWLHSDALFGDLRVDVNRRAALCWCSECEHYFLAEYTKKETKALGSPRKGIECPTAWDREGTEFFEGDEMECLSCSAIAELVHTSSIHEARHIECEAMVPTVFENRLVLTQYLYTRYVGKNSCETFLEPIKCFVVEEKKIVRLSRWQRCGYGWTRRDDWRVLRYRDDLVDCHCYDENLPCLDGTCLENAKVWEYLRDGWACKFVLGYLKTYQKHHNVENLVMAGLGYLLDKQMYDESLSSGWCGCAMAHYMSVPVFDWIDWKKAKPHQMLGVSKEELRQIVQRKAKLELVKLWQSMIKDGTAKRYSFAELADAFENWNVWNIQKAIGEQIPLMKTVRYLEKQNTNVQMLWDYYQALRDLGTYERAPDILFPKNLLAEHDRTTGLVRFKGDEETKAAFERMSKLCKGLEWQKDGICIVMPKTADDLVVEGTVLRHCVKGASYAKGHAAGRIILFVRHARRPERPWYTLNIDLKSKEQIQLHGYRNEHVPSGHHREVYSEVLKFVEEWKQEVLAGFVLPLAKAPRKKKKKAA